MEVTNNTLFFAFRYAVRRNTGVLLDVSKQIKKNLHLIGDLEREQYIDEIELAKTHEDLQDYSIRMCDDLIKILKEQG